MTEPKEERLDEETGPIETETVEPEADPKEELEATRAALLRALADNDNLRKRTEREIAKARQFGAERLVGDLLPVLDSLDRALDEVKNTPASEATWREGTELTRRLLLETLAQHGVTRIEPLGEPFDPEQHEALRVVEMDGVDPNTVVAVLDKGYLLNGRLVRPARVAVSPPQAER